MKPKSQQYLFIAITFAVIIFISYFLLLKLCFIKPCKTNYEILTLSAIQSVIMALLSPILLKYSEKKSLQKAKKNIRFFKSDTEEFIFEELTQYIIKRTKTTGKLYLTTERLVFVPHEDLVNQKPITINPHDIEIIETFKFLKILNTGLYIQLKNNETYRFTVYQNIEWVKQLNNYIQAA